MSYVSLRAPVIVFGIAKSSMLIQQLYSPATKLCNLEINFISYVSFRAPGIVFGIAKDGELILKGGIGYADVENGILCNSSTVMRIASISKSLTSIAVGKS